jgi:acyl carrier protein
VTIRENKKTARLPMNYAKEIREFVVTNFLFGEAGSLQDDTSFLDGGIIDSTGILELIMFLENTYGIKIQPEEMIPQNLDGINRVVQFLARKLADQSPDSQP